MNEKAKKIISTTVNVLIWIFVAFSVFMTVIAFSAQGKNNDGVPTIFGKGFITIETDSMTGTFNKGDLVFMTRLDDEEKKDLDVKTIITYRSPVDLNGDGKSGDLNTHRIYSKDEGALSYVTKGDNNPGHDNEGDNPYKVYYSEIVGTCEEGARIPGLGAVLSFLRTGLGFFLCIVLPLILFFLYEVYVFVSVLVSERAKKAAGVAEENAEQIRRQAVEEYIRSLEAQKAAADAALEDTEGSEPSEQENSSEEENK